MSTSLPTPPTQSNSVEHRDVLISRFAGAVVLAANFLIPFIVEQRVVPSLILFLLPLTVGSIVALLAMESLTARIDGWGESFEKKLEAARTHDGKFAKWFKRPLFGGLSALWRLTAGSKFHHLKAWGRVSGLLYFGGVMIYLLIIAVYIIVILAIIAFALWAFTRGKESTQESVPSRFAAGRSYEREGLMGKYVESFDENGEKIGESRTRDGFLGKYTEHTNTEGELVGESRNRDGIFETYAEHTDANGNKVGESHKREGFFDEYVEHTDKEGKKVGESHQRDGFFGPYVEHSEK